MLLSERQVALLIGTMLYNAPGRSLTVRAEDMVCFKPEEWEMVIIPNHQRNSVTYQLVRRGGEQRLLPKTAP